MDDRSERMGGAVSGAEDNGVDGSGGGARDGAAERIGVLFVCLGNICRSPLAEGVFAEVVRRAGLEAMFDVDSAGTSNYHRGEAPDPRTVETAARRGVTLSHAARQITGADLHRFEYVVVMDEPNLMKVRRLAATIRPDAELHLLRAFDEEAVDEWEVPDPYFGGADGFEDVHEMVERSCRGLLRHIREERGF
jgi:protein-tyrosine phosphatase